MALGGSQSVVAFINVSQKVATTMLVTLFCLILGEDLIIIGKFDEYFTWPGQDGDERSLTAFFDRNILRTKGSPVMAPPRDPLQCSYTHKRAPYSLKLAHSNFTNGNSSNGSLENKCEQIFFKKSEREEAQCPLVILNYQTS